MPSEKERVVRRQLATGEVKEYRYARKPPKEPRQAADSLGALIIAYRRSLEWAINAKHDKSATCTGNNACCSGSVLNLCPGKARAVL
jgi:hypothetical protein